MHKGRRSEWEEGGGRYNAVVLDICYKSRSPAVWERAVLKLSFKMQRFRLRDFGFLQFGASMKTLD